eukprot:symbB.v1.2.002199.t2/scaffold96.1/size336774/16
MKSGWLFDPLHRSGERRSRSFTNGSWPLWQLLSLCPLVRRAVPWRHKDLARKWLLDGKVALKDGNFPAVEEKSHMVLRLADGWQPPGSLLSIPPSSNVAPSIDLTCPFAVEALQLRLLGRLHLGAFDTALMDAKKLQKTRHWAALGRLAASVALLHLGEVEKVQMEAEEMASHLEMGEQFRRAWRRLRCLSTSTSSDLIEAVYFDQDVDESGSLDDLDELEESAWHVASVLPAIPNFVHPSLEVVLFPNGQRGVVVTEDVAQGELLMAASAVVFQGPEAWPKLKRGGKLSGPEQLVKVFQDPTAPMQKALQSAVASGSSLMAMALSQLSDGKTQPEVSGHVLQELCEPFQSRKLHTKSHFTAQELFGILKTNGFSCDGHAWGLWITISFVNHSCAPSAHYVITQKEEGSASCARRGGTMLLRAARDLKVNDEVTFEYFGAQHALMNLRDRRDITEKHGADGFRCACTRCSSEEREVAKPTETSTSALTLRYGAPASMEHLEVLEDDNEWLHWLQVRYGNCESSRLKAIHAAARETAFPASFVQVVQDVKSDFMAAKEQADATPDVQHQFHFRYDRRLSCFSNSVSCLNFTTDGHFLVSGTGSGDIKVWDCGTWAEAAKLKSGRRAEPKEVAISPSQRWVVVCYSAMLQIFQCGPPWKLVCTRPVETGNKEAAPEWCCVAFSPAMSEVDHPGGQAGQDRC